MNKIPAIVGWALVVAIVGTSCGTGAGPAGDESGGASSAGTPGAQNTQVAVALPEPAPTNSAEAIANVARITYEALVAGADLTPYIEGVMTAFGVPPLGENDEKLAAERYSQGLPLMFVPQMANLAEAFYDGGSVSLDGFIVGANEQGARQRGTDEPLTREYLTQKFADYMGSAQYEPGEVLPAFVLALGQERASRFPTENADPIWGDGLLDPLQLTLLLYAVSYSGADAQTYQAPRTAGAVDRAMNISFIGEPIQAPLPASPAKGGPVVNWVKDQIQGEVEGAVQDSIEVPLDKVEAAQVSVCASLLLYGHKIKVTTTPREIYHKDGTHPWSTRVDAVLTFQDDYHDNYLPINRWMLENLGNCDLPRQGPVEGKPLEWSVSDGLAGHGNYNIVPAATGDGGTASANWQTIPETTPVDQRTFANQRDAVGAAIVRAGSLVPGWSGLERIVGALKDTGNTGDSPITVIYYAGKGYKATGQQEEITYSGSICDLGQSFAVEATSAYYKITLQFAPSGSKGGSYTESGEWFDVGGMDGGGSYTVEGTDEAATGLNLNGSTCTHTPVGTVCKDLQFNIDLVPLEAGECGQP
jgi:hypothetical protein